ncbi:MAG: hypothetical protein ACRDYC_05095, partial [Acidimicrobiales bacterium]
AWLSSLLDSSSPPEDHKRGRLARTFAAPQIEGEISNRTLVARLAVIVQLAKELDRGTLELALQIVPVEWWQARLGESATSTIRDPTAGNVSTHRRPGGTRR